MRKFLPYGHQYIDQSDIDTVAEVLKSDEITSGSKVQEFEKKIAKYCGAKYAVAVSSGTAALHSACFVAGITEGDEVITTPMTFFGTVSSIIACGGTPILVDIQSDTLNIDINEVKNQITEKTRAVIPVDFAGHPAELHPLINTLRGNKGVVVIEDACHALGARYKRKMLGSISDMTVFSFHPVKLLTTAEGGMILTNNQTYYDKLRRFRNHNFIKGEKYWQYELKQPGCNYRLTEMQAALGISQLKKIDWFIARRRELARIYNEAFADIDEIITPTEYGLEHVYHIYVIQLKTLDREAVIEALVKENIGAQIHYTPIHYFDYMQRKFGYSKGDFPNAERYYNRAITLPLFPAMTDKDVEYVIKVIKKVVNKRGRN